MITKMLYSYPTSMMKSGSRVKEFAIYYYGRILPQTIIAQIIGLEFVSFFPPLQKR